MSHQALGQPEIHRVAHRLASLALTPADEQQSIADLERILGHLDKLEQADVQGVAPTIHALPQSATWRSDEVMPSLPVERALANAPERLGDGFGVPKIIE